VEWVETVGKSVEEAKDRALDLLGVDERDAEFEVLEEPRVGFLGRVKGSARVRARIRPAVPRAKTERRDRRRRTETGARGGRGRRGNGGNGGNGGSRTDERPSDRPAEVAVATGAAAVDEDDAEGGDRADATGAASGGSRSRSRRRRSRGGRGRTGGGRAAEAGAAEDRDATDDRHPDDDRHEPHDQEPHDQKVATMPELSLDEQARIVASFLDGLVDAFGLDATTSWEHTDEENTEVRVEGANLGLLVGPKGRTLQAVTEVARSVVVRHGEGGSTGRVHVDVAGYRQRRREALGRFAVEVADEVRATGVPRALEPMSAADRKVVHDTVAALEGVTSTSEGEEPYRRVVINPA
jgi:spoIIIJ-associated protein